jgi:hypothetical protein
MVGMAQKWKEILWWGWHKNEKKSHGGGGTKMKKEISWWGWHENEKITSC